MEVKNKMTNINAKAASAWKDVLSMIDRKIASDIAFNGCRAAIRVPNPMGYIGTVVDIASTHQVLTLIAR